MRFVSIKHTAEKKTQKMFYISVLILLHIYIYISPFRTCFVRYLFFNHHFKLWEEAVFFLDQEAGSFTAHENAKSSPKHSSVALLDRFSAHGGFGALLYNALCIPTRSTPTSYIWCNRTRISRVFSPQLPINKEIYYC